MAHRAANGMAARRRAAVALAREPGQQMRVFSLLAAMPGAGMLETARALAAIGVHDQFKIHHLQPAQLRRLEQLLLAHPGSW